MPVVVMVWKSWNTASWTGCGMCFRRTPGMLSGPGELWLGRCLWALPTFAGVCLSMIMCWWGGVVAGIPFNHGNGAWGSLLGSGESKVVSIFSTIAMTSAGLLVISHVSGSRSADKCCVFGACVLEVDAFFRIALSASLGFFTNIHKRAAP